MKLSAEDLIFDTVVDTVKLFVSMKTSFKIRSYKSKPEIGYVYLVASGNRERVRFNLDLEIPLKFWDQKKQRLVSNDTQLNDFNLFLDNIEAKITGVRTVYRLSEKVLTPSALKKELENGMVRVDFIAFFRQSLDESRANIRKGTFRRYESTLKKLERYAPKIYFSELDLAFFEKYRIWLSEELDNKRSTVNSNIIAIKKHLGIAKKYGIKLKFDLDDLKGGNTSGHRDYLNREELKKFADLYFRMKRGNSKVIAGYFMFSCFTGLRVGDLTDLERSGLYGEDIFFINQKSDRPQRIELNQSCRRILDECDELFVKKFSHEYMNRVLKILAVRAGIEKNISFHVARHTFATNFLRSGGKVENLQKLLNHQSISTTMEYVHIIAEEANKEIYLLDGLLD